MAKRDRPRNLYLAKQAKIAQPFCRRCLCHSKLIAHHVWALADGGPDTLDNLDVLCRWCHDEWHDHAEPIGLTYEAFLRTLPVKVMLVMQASNAYQLQGQTMQRLLENHERSLAHQAEIDGITRPPFPEAWRNIPDRDEPRLYPVTIRPVRVAWGSPTSA